MENGEYEFSAEQNTVVGNLAGKMKIVGIIMLVMGALTSLSGILGDKSNILVGLLNAAVGIFTMNAAKSFQLIVDTQGSDMTNLMNAFSQLIKLYAVQLWLYAITIFVIILGMIVVAVIGAGASGGKVMPF